MPLPSLEQLKNQCTIIGEELGCAAPPLPRATAETATAYCTGSLASTHRHQYVLCATPLHAGCDKDEDFSSHYGQPVYVCKI